MTLNEYAGLFGEVVTCDSYHLRDVDFTPDIVFDIGANVGVFTRFARSMWPDVKVVAVEPHPSNIDFFKRLTTDRRGVAPDPNISLVEAALGNGTAYLYEGGNGSQHCFLSAGLGYPLEKLKKDPRCAANSVPTLSLTQIMQPFLRAGQKTLLKVDCEGGENVLWPDVAAMALIKTVDYVVIELHYFAIDGVVHPEVLKMTNDALASLEATHHCKKEGIYFYARRKS